MHLDVLVFSGDGGLKCVCAPKCLISLLRTSTTALFGDHLSAVRILGGLASRLPNGTYVPQPEFDLVQRDNLGNLIANWSRVDATFDAFIAAGVTPSPVVLDNVPYAFVKKPTYGGYGQASAPDNATEFALFVGEFIQHLVTRYGHQEVGSWMFRLGTECNGPRFGPRFEEGGLDTYIEVYDAVGAVIKSVLPSALYGPSNFAGVGTHNCTTCSYLTEFAIHIKNGTNRATGGHGSPLDFWGLSDYSHMAHGAAPPAYECDAPTMLAQLSDIAETPNAHRHLMEFGWAGWLNFTDEAPWPAGVFGGTWTAGSWAWLETCGIDRVYHWEYYFDNSLSHNVTSGGYPLVAGTGWLMAAAESLIGASTNHSFVVHMDPTNWTLGVWQGIHNVMDSENHTAHRFQSSTREIDYLLTLSTGNYTESSSHQISLTIPATDILGTTGMPTITQRVLNKSTSVLDVIHQDLTAAGGYPQYLVHSDPSVSTVRTMATPEGLAWAEKQTDRYMAVSSAALRDTPFEGSVSHDGDELRLEFEGTLPSIILLKVKWA